MTKVFVVLSYIIDIGLIILISAFLIDTVFFDEYDNTFDLEDILIPFAIVSRGVTGLYFVFSTQKLYFKPPVQKDILDEDIQQEDFAFNGVLAPGIFNLILSVVFIVFLSTSLSDFDLSFEQEISSEDNEYGPIAIICGGIVFFAASIIYVISSFIQIRKIYLKSKADE